MAKAKNLRSCLLAWYDAHQRPLPWRESKDPYRILVSEMMLQQTQVQTVLPYYQRFLTHWPTVEALAEAELESVLQVWQGLGYYRRARHLHAAARKVAGDFQGRFPSDEKALRSLPGIGDYTAGAIASIAFGKVAAAIDGNVNRVISRLTLLLHPKQNRRTVQDHVLTLICPERPGDFNQALMELGATICLPQNPSCHVCPIAAFCQAKSLGRVSQYPHRMKAKALNREWLVVVIQEYGGKIMVHRNAGSSLLSGLYSFDWLDENRNITARFEDAIHDAPLDFDRARAELKTTFPQARLIDLGAATHTLSGRRWHLEALLLRHDPADLQSAATSPLRPLGDLPMTKPLAGYRSLLGKIIPQPQAFHPKAD